VSVETPLPHTMQARLGRCATCMRWTAFGVVLSWTALAATGLLLPAASTLTVAALAVTVAAAAVFTVLGMLHLVTWWTLRSHPVATVGSISYDSEVVTNAGLRPTAPRGIAAAGCGVCGQTRRR
jgi:hypothetical protein